MNSEALLWILVISSERAEYFALANADVSQRAVGGREADPERQFAGRLLLDLDRDDGAVRRRAWAVGDLHLLEEPEVLDTLLGAVHLVGVEGVALDEAEL